jgi:hypothetical protein
MSITKPFIYNIYNQLLIRTTLQVTARRADPNSYQNSHQILDIQAVTGR